MDNIMVDLMSRFLKNSFPVSRIKSGKRFKRGVDIDGNNFFLSGSSGAFKIKIYDSLKGCYGASDDEINAAISNFYGIN